MTIFLIDPYLIDYSGHCFNYLEKLRQSLVERGAEVRMVGNEICTGNVQKKGVEPLFPKSALSAVKYKLRNTISNLIKRCFGLSATNDVTDFEVAFEHTVKRLHATSNDVVFINSLRPWQFLAAVQWLSRQEKNSVPKLAVVLHFTSNLRNYSGQIFAYHYRSAFRLIDQAQLAPYLQIFADTEELVSEFKALGAKNILLAPIPVLLPSTALQQSDHRMTDDGEIHPLVIAYVGQARRDKGFHTLPKICEKLSPLMMAGKIILKIQIGDPSKLAPFEKATAATLENMGCKLIPENLAADDYTRFLVSSNIILLPYTGLAYRSQSSGVFAEAMALGKMVIAPRDTWMGKELAKLGFDFLSVPPRPDDVSAAVINLRNADLEMSALYTAGCAAWTKKNSFADFIDALVK
jgi:glycosyltransferase involved in cell wall biosynthesis